jgi:hypothetical protein
MPHQTIHISTAEDLTRYFPASPTESHASTEALYIPAPGTPYQTTSPPGTLPIVEDAPPTNTARVLAVDLTIGAAQPAIPLSPRAISAIVKGQANALTAPVLLRMVCGLVLTAKRTEDRMEAVRITAEEQAMELEQSKDQCDVLTLGARNLQLEHDAQAKSLRLANLTIRRLATQPPRGQTFHRASSLRPLKDLLRTTGSSIISPSPSKAAATTAASPPTSNFSMAPFPVLPVPWEALTTLSLLQRSMPSPAPTSALPICQYPSGYSVPLTGTPRSSRPSHWRSKI